MTGEQIIVAIGLVAGIATMFWLADDWREIFAEPFDDIFGDVPNLPEGFVRNETDGESIAGGRDGPSAARLVRESHSHEQRFNK